MTPAQFNEYQRQADVIDEAKKWKEQNPLGFNLKPYEIKSSKYRWFLNYHTENPLIYAEFERETFIAISSGSKNFGSQLIIEHLRWLNIIAAKNDSYKINNDAAPFYARMFMLKFPSYAGYFRTKSSFANELKLEDL
jgi:hypothetical protein